MHPPPKDRHVWVPKSKTTTPAAAAENETPSTSSSKITQNASSRITRAITRAVSTILPSHSANTSTPSPGLSSILSRRVACEPTTSSNANKETTPGATPSKATNNRRHVRKETTTPNPILRTNLLTATPTFKDAGVTDTVGNHVAGNYSRKPPVIPIVGNYSRNTIPPVNDSHKGKRSAIIRSARKAAAPSPILRPDLHVLNSADKVSGGASSIKRVSGHSQQPQNIVHRASASKSLANVSVNDPKGKGAVTSGNQAFKRKALDNRSAYGSYEQLLKDHFISSSDSEQLLLGPIPLGKKCQLCAIDLAYLPYNSSSGTSTDPPMCAVLPCGHALHASCLEQVYGSSFEPQCLSCASGSPKLGK